MEDYIGAIAEYAYKPKNSTKVLRAKSIITHIFEKDNKTFFCFKSGAIIDVHNCSNIKKPTPKQ